MPRLGHVTAMLSWPDATTLFRWGERFLCQKTRRPGNEDTPSTPHLIHGSIWGSPLHARHVSLELFTVFPYGEGHEPCAPCRCTPGDSADVQARFRVRQGRIVQRNPTRAADVRRRSVWISSLQLLLSREPPILHGQFPMRGLEHRSVVKEIMRADGSDHYHDILVCFNS